jgi:hypothetical protein
MSCLPSACTSRQRAPLPTMELKVDLPPAVRDRAAAVVFLRAASLTEERHQREFLRRRAAELILPRPAPARAALLA